MAQITLQGNPINTVGTLPQTGSKAPEFNLTTTQLIDTTLATYAGKKVVLNIFPSLDTAVCAASVRRFNKEAGEMKNTVVIDISRDLPFAHNRFCVAEGLNNVISTSSMRDEKFGNDYGVRIVDGPMAGLLARAVVVIDEQGIVKYTELVPEIVNEPDYEKALAQLL